MRAMHDAGSMKSYDPVLMKRLTVFLRPHLAYFLLALAAVLLATAGELYTPILIQRAVDRHILPYHRALQIDEAAAATVQKLKANGPAVEIEVEGIYYFPATLLSNLNRQEKEDWIDRGIMSSENYFVFDDAGAPEIAAVISRHTQFQTEGNQAVILVQDLKTLPIEDIRILRQKQYQGLFALTVQFFFVLLGVLLFTFGQVYLLAYVGQMFMRDLRIKLYEHTLGLSLEYADSNPVGKLVTRITNDVETVNELFTTVLSSFLRDFALLFGVLVVLFILNPRLALFTMISLPPVLVLTLLFRVRARDVYRRVRRAVSEVNAFLSEHISGMHIVQMFSKEKRSKREFDQQNTDLLNANLSEMYVFAIFRPVVDLLSTISIAVIIYFGARFLLQGMISLGVLIAFLNLIRKFYEPVRDLSEKYNILQSAMAGAERVFELLDEQSTISQPENPVLLENPQGAIEFDKVCFWYKEGEPVINNLSFRIEPGETVAVVGYTGAGKTTITSLLSRLWDIQGGTIKLDGINIKDIPTSILRRRVQSVLQDVFLFSGTIEDNIRLGEDIPTEVIKRAVTMAQADSIVQQQPEGLQTELSERAGNLSVGQRQLLSFARVLAHDPDILILDEATGNIDTETEKLIQEALKKLLHGRTSLVIAHRLSTIREADRILVLHKGTLFESGTHDELMQKQGMYYNLYRMQFQEQG